MRALSKPFLVRLSLFFANRGEQFEPDKSLVGTDLAACDQQE
jgi:hypothetical protein